MLGIVSAIVLGAAVGAAAFVTIHHSIGAGIVWGLPALVASFILIDISYTLVDPRVRLA